MIEVIEGTPEDWRETLKGAKGDSSYKIAVDNGFVGTEKEWLDSLKLTFDELTEEQKTELRGPNIWMD